MPESHYIELADGTKTSGVALKRGDAEVCQLDVNGNHLVVILKRVLTLAQRLECSPMARETWVQSQVESYQRL